MLCPLMHYQTTLAKQHQGCNFVLHTGQKCPGKQGVARSKQLHFDSEAAEPIEIHVNGTPSDIAKEQNWSCVYHEPIRLT